VDLIRYVVKAVVLESLSVREVAAAHGVSRSWVYECLARYRAEGDHVVIQLRG
jgi:transposase